MAYVQKNLKKKLRLVQMDDRDGLGVTRARVLDRHIFDATIFMHLLDVDRRIEDPFIQCLQLLNQFASGQGTGARSLFELFTP